MLDNAETLEIHLKSRSAQQTRHFGELLGSAIARTFRCHSDDNISLVLALTGDLGSGKTTLTQGIATGLGLEEQVTSPTFTLINEYVLDKFGADSTKTSREPLKLIHIDSYRLAEQTELDAATIGLDEYFTIPLTVLVVEWAERLKDVLPTNTIYITLAYATHQEASSPASGRTLTLKTNDVLAIKILSQDPFNLVRHE